MPIVYEFKPHGAYNYGRFMVQLRLVNPKGKTIVSGEFECGMN